jgi:hypothetical protein
MSSTGKTILIVVGLLVIGCCCITFCCLGTSGIITALNLTEGNSQLDDFFDEFNHIEFETTPQVNFSENQYFDAEAANETLEKLSEGFIPVNDPVELGERLGNTPDIPRVIDGEPQIYQIGDEESFWIIDGDTDESIEVTASLAMVQPHVYFWIENGIDYNQRDLERLVTTFEDEIYPTNRAFFGSEWSPGVDNDPRLYILYTRGLGSQIAGYFSSVDSLHPLAHEYSNGHEMFMLNADAIGLDEDFTYGVLAHEFQHMIHWYQDKNETTWLNEGFSELAAFLNGYYLGGFDWVYASDPDMQLNTWPSEDSTPHYGASFLFVNYFLNRFGEQTTKQVVAHPENGFESIDAVLKELNIFDNETGEPITADELFRDWTLATYLQDYSIEDGRYTYLNYEEVPSVYDTESIYGCDGDWKNRSVSQYGVDYIRINSDQNCEFNFESLQSVKVVPMDAHSGDYSFWSNKGDESDMRLTREFDFSNVEEPIVFEYWISYDIEEGYDYVYLLASEDGDNWKILETPSSTDLDPSGNSYGSAYNGNRDWIKETVDLSEYAGKSIYLRFEYVTDAAVNGQGLLLDDLTISAIDYKTDFEEDSGGWIAEGFVRIQNTLAQSFLISVIKYGDATTLDKYIVNADDPNLIISLDFDEGLSDAVIVISGATRFTEEPAIYRYSVD